MGAKQDKMDVTEIVMPGAGFAGLGALLLAVRVALHPELVAGELGHLLPVEGVPVVVGQELRVGFALAVQVLIPEMKNI